MYSQLTFRQQQCITQLLKEVALAIGRLREDEQRTAVTRTLRTIHQIKDTECLAACLAAMTPQLPSELLGGVLDAAQAIEHEGKRAECLAALAPHLSSELFGQALDIARAIKHETSQVKAIAALAPRLPSELLGGVLDAAQAIEHEGKRAECLAALAPHLSSELLGQALDIARAIKHETSQVKAIAALAPRLPSELLGGVLDAAQAIEHEGERAECLAALAPHLSSELFGQALDIARTIKRETSQVKAIAALAPRLPSELLGGVLGAARAIEHEGERAEYLVALAPHLSSELLGQAFDIARTVKRETSQVKAIAALAPRLPSELLGGVLDAALGRAFNAVRAIRDERYRAKALVDLAPHLPSEFLGQALDIVHAIDHEESRANALAVLAPLLPSELLRQALDIAQAGVLRRPRAQALAALAPCLPSELLGQALDAAIAIESYHRNHVLVALAPHLPSELWSQALDAAQALKDERNRAEALVDLAAHLPSGLLEHALNAALGQALDAVEAVKDEHNRVGALRALTKHLPSELLGQAFGIARAIENEIGHIRALAELAPRLQSELSDQAVNTALGQALDVAQAIKDVLKRTEAIAILAPHLPPELLSQALDAAQALKEERNRTEAVAAIARRLAPDKQFSILIKALHDILTIQPKEWTHQFKGLRFESNALPRRQGRLLTPIDSEEEPRSKAAPADDAIEVVRPVDGNEENERFLDPTLYRGHYAVGDAPDPDDIVLDHESIEEHESYTLEIAIRSKTIGIDRDTTAPAVIRPRREPNEAVTVYARVEARDETVLKFEDAFLPIKWEFERDSESAFFRCETFSPQRDRNFTDIDILLYSEELHLLEVTTIRDVVVGHNACGKRRHKHWPENRPAALTPSARDEPVGLTIRIKGAPQGYTAELIFRVGPNRLQPIPLGRVIPFDDIRALLTRVRDYWTGLVVGQLSAREQVTKATYSRYMADMWRLGGAAWRLLFGNDEKGGAAALGRLIRSLDLPTDSLIQVSCREDARNFVFPWSILRPHPASGDDPEPDQFWGLRYQVELTNRKGSRKLGLSRKPVHIATVVDPGFAGALDHKASLKAVIGMNRRTMVTSIDTWEALKDSLSQAQPAQLYYFFCQGFTPGEAPHLAADAIKSLRELAEASETPGLWSILLNRLSAVPGEATMFIGQASISETELNELQFFQSRSRPIVFLNMCHSADLLPAMGHGIARRFIERNASAVLGTECPMTAVFADLFAQKILGALVRYRTIGKAVVDARRHFHKERNPLGFAYTLYGRADADLGTMPDVGTAKSDLVG